jgi:exodeoxyribonuclease V beta subunit
LTSFTRIKGSAEISPPIEGEREGSEALLFSEALEIAPDLLLKQSDIQELPGGRETGIFLHALIENTPAAELRGIALADWMALDTVIARAKKLATKYGFHFERLPAALQLVFNALTLPLEIDSREKTATLKMPEGLASADRVRQEMAFAYPIPEADHPLLGNHGAEHNPDQTLPFEVGRGYLQGLIDYVFEHEGRVYLLDWKSDRLTDFGAASIDLHVQNNYSLQAGIYSLAVIRLLGILSETDYNSRFGGVIYIFLRGLQAGEGAWFSRPGWIDLLKLERDLLQRTQWGGAVIAQPLKRSARGEKGGDYR